jgi:hypothetical protein
MRQFVGEVLRIADAEDPASRVMAQAPGRKGDRGRMRFNGFLIPYWLQPYAVEKGVLCRGSLWRVHTRAPAGCAR